MYPIIMFFGHEIDVYNLMYAAGFIGMLMICLLTHKSYGIGKIRAVIYSAVTFVFGVAGAMLMASIYTSIMTSVSDGVYVPESRVCLYGALFFLPVFMFILSLVVKNNFGELLDYMTPGVFLILAFSKIGCLMYGCCYGIADDNGVYNHRLDYTVFPVQLYESVCTFAIVIILIVSALKIRKIKSGTLYPIGMILYSITRMVWENYRFYEHECEYHFIGKLTFWQCCSLLSIVIGIIWLVLLFFSPNLKNAVNSGVARTKKFADDTHNASEDRRRTKHRKKAEKYQKKYKKLKAKK